MTATKLTAEDLIEQLQGMSREETTEVLSHLKKAELVELAKVAGISVDRAGNKDRIIGQIANHYGFRRLNKAMAQRPDMVR
jgi:hypothetical protein